MPFGMVGIGFRVHDARVGWCPVKQKTSSLGPKLRNPTKSKLLPFFS